jgi:spermidine/putrescine transport system permease protein
LGGSNTMLWGNLIQNELLKSHDMPFAAALSVILLAMTAIVLIIYRRKGGEAENMAF